MDWGSPTHELDEIGKYLDNERANKALAGIVGSILAESGEIPLDPQSADFGQQAAIKQGRMGDALLKGIASHPDIGYMPLSQTGNLATSALNLQTKPLDFQMKEFEKQQNKRALEEQRQTGRIDLQDQRAADRLKLEQERKTKIRELQMLRANGDITDEEYKQAVMVNYGLQPQARQAPGPLEIFKQLQTMPPEQRSAFYNHQREMNPKAFQINTGGGGGLTPAQSGVAAYRLRNELKSNPYVQNFRDVDGKYQVMVQALQEAPQAKTLVGVDQALISLFNKMTDPDSVVRESEYARTGRDMSLLNRIKGKAEKVMSGGAGLTTDERQALVDMGTKFYNTYAEKYNSAITDMNELSQLEGIDPRRVNTTYKPAKMYQTGGNQKQQKGQQSVSKDAAIQELRRRGVIK